MLLPCVGRPGLRALQNNPSIMSVPGQFDDADSPLTRPSKRENLFQVLGPRKSSPTPSDVTAPGDCSTRSAREDAKDVAVEFKARLDGMDSTLLVSLVQARESAANISAAFPNGDQRFAPFDSDSDEDGLRWEDGDGAGAGGGNKTENGRKFEDDGGDEVLDKGEEQEEGEAEPCAGLLDNQTDSGPRAALDRALKEYGLDLMGEMERGKLDLFARIRLANYVRRCVANGDGPKEVVKKVMDAVSAGSMEGVLADNGLLMPVLEGDVLLTVLEGDELLDDDMDSPDGVAGAVQNGLGLTDSSQRV